MEFKKPVLVCFVVEEEDYIGKKGPWTAPEKALCFADKALGSSLDHWKAQGVAMAYAFYRALNPNTITKV